MTTQTTFAPGNDAPVLLERLSGHISLVTLNRPHVRNAVNAAMASALEAIVDETEADPDIRTIVLTASGSSVFCSGADLKEVASGRGAGLYTARGGFAGLVHANRSKPWVAAVAGKALAGGFEIVLSCDLVVAGEDAAFGLPEVSRGVIAAAGGLYRAPRALPRNIALELIMTADTIDAHQAHRYGVVNRVVCADRVRDEAVALASRIVRNAPLAVRESLRVARQAHDLGEAELRALSMQAQDRIVQSEDYREGPRAFVEKREPRWTGR